MSRRMRLDAYFMNVRKKHSEGTAVDSCSTRRGCQADVWAVLEGRKRDEETVAAAE